MKKVFGFVRIDTMDDDKIVKFPDDRVVREVTAVSFEKIQKFLLYHKIAENAGAELWQHNFAVSFRTMDDFERFCEMLTSVE